MEISRGAERRGGRRGGGRRRLRLRLSLSLRGRFRAGGRGVLVLREEEPSRAARAGVVLLVVVEGIEGIEGIFVLARARRGGGGEIPDDGSPSLADPARGVDERERLRGEADGFAAGRGEAHAPRVRVDAVEGIVGRGARGRSVPGGGETVPRRGSRGGVRGARGRGLRGPDARDAVRGGRRARLDGVLHRAGDDDVTHGEDLGVERDGDERHDEHAQEEGAPARRGGGSDAPHRARGPRLGLDGGRHVRRPGAAEAVEEADLLPRLRRLRREPPRVLRGGVPSRGIAPSRAVQLRLPRVRVEPGDVAVAAPEETNRGGARGLPPGRTLSSGRDPRVFAHGVASASASRPRARCARPRGGRKILNTQPKTTTPFKAGVFRSRSVRFPRSRRRRSGARGVRRAVNRG